MTLDQYTVIAEIGRERRRSTGRLDGENFPASAGAAPEMTA